MIGIARMFRKSALAVVLLMVPLSAARADPVADFYAGKTIQMLIGFGVGGGYDIYGRIVARHMARHIPGNPTIVPQNMPGAGGFLEANYLFSAAPKDGTVIGVLSRGLPMDALLGTDGMTIDASKYNWLGSVTNEVDVCTFWHQSGIHSWQDMVTKDATVGSAGASDDTAVYANVLRNIFHAKLKLVTGYQGTAEMVVALERGELSGICGMSWSTLLSRNKARYESKELEVTVQLALSPHEDLPTVPLVTSLTKDPKDLAALRLILARQVMARPFAAPPGIPQDRARALRDAFDATMKDASFLEEARRSNLEVRPVSSSQVDALVAETYKAPAEVVKSAAAATKGEAR